MKYTLDETEQAVTLEPAGEAGASIIWLHGLGADGHDFVPIVPELRLPQALAVRFIFPQAPVRPVTINNGMHMRAWYDIRGFTPDIPEDEPGLRASARLVDELVEQQAGDGVDTRRIVLAGFSQGGVIALHAGLRSAQPLGGVLGLSTYLGLRGSLASEASSVNAQVPILMCHGRQDGVIPLERAQRSRDLLRGAGYQVEWQEYPMQHEVCMAEIAAISRWLESRLTPHSAPRGRA